MMRTPFRAGNIQVSHEYISNSQLFFKFSTECVLFSGQLFQVRKDFWKILNNLSPKIIIIAIYLIAWIVAVSLWCWKCALFNIKLKKCHRITLCLFKKRIIRGNNVHKHIAHTVISNWKWFFSSFIITRDAKSFSRITSNERLFIT